MKRTESGLYIPVQSIWPASRHICDRNAAGLIISSSNIRKHSQQQCSAVPAVATSAAAAKASSFCVDCDIDPDVAVEGEADAIVIDPDVLFL
eukprot:990-Heterococcus_DN1.PRE.3